PAASSFRPFEQIPRQHRPAAALRLVANHSALAHATLGYIRQIACQAAERCLARAKPRFHGEIRICPCHSERGATLSNCPYYCIAMTCELWFERLDFGCLTIWHGHLLAAFPAAGRGADRAASLANRLDALGMFSKGARTA